MVRINLIPPAQRTSRARRQRIRRWFVASCITVFFLCIVGAAEAVSRTQLRQAEREQQRVLAEFATTRAALKSIVAQVEGARRRIQRAEALQAKRSWSGMLGLLAGALPDGAWLATVATDPPQPTAAARRAQQANSNSGGSDGAESPIIVIEAPRKLRVSGYCESAADPHTIVSRLKQAGVFTDVLLEESRSEALATGEYFQFQLLCTW